MTCGGFCGEGVVNEYVYKEFTGPCGETVRVYVCWTGDVETIYNPFFVYVCKNGKYVIKKNCRYDELNCDHAFHQKCITCTLNKLLQHLQHHLKTTNPGNSKS